MITIECVSDRTAGQCNQGLEEACGELALPYSVKVTRWMKSSTKNVEMWQVGTSQVDLVSKKKPLLFSSN